MIKKKSLTSSAALIILLVAAGFLAQTEYRQWQKEQKIDKQKHSLQQEADELQQKNNQLAKSLDLINSPDFKESIARQQLNLKMQGETVYGFNDQAPSPASLQEDSKQSPGSNFENWLNYFFK